MNYRRSIKPVSRSLMLKSSQKKALLALSNKVRRVNNQKLTKPQLPNNIRKRIYSEARITMGPKYNASLPKRPSMKELSSRINELTNAIDTLNWVDRLFRFQGIYFDIGGFNSNNVYTFYDTVSYHLVKILNLNMGTPLFKSNDKLKRILKLNKKSSTRKNTINAIWDGLLRNMDTNYIKLLKLLAKRSESHAQQWLIQFPHTSNLNNTLTQDSLMAHIQFIQVYMLFSCNIYVT